MRLVITVWQCGPLARLRALRAGTFPPMTEAATERVERVVRERFDGASLQPPEFRDLPSLRFELGGELDPWYRWLGETRIFDLPGALSRRQRRIRQAVDRAVQVYDGLFEQGDSGFFVAYLWPGARPNEERLVALLPEDSRSAVERSCGVNYWADPDGEDRYVRLVAPCAPRALAYRSLFRMIAQAELGLEPAVSGEIFVVNETRPAIFKMYDDRGAIVYAPSSERLAPIAEAHGSWLVRDTGSRVRLVHDNRDRGEHESDRE